jgi:hypothetical protein
MNINSLHKNYFETKDEIKAWLDALDVKNYVIHDNLVVDVNDRVYLNFKLGGRKYLPLQFGLVKGDFCIKQNNLTTLKGSPHTVLGRFECMGNPLSSFDYLPKVMERLDCSGKITLKDLMKTQLKYGICHECKTKDEQISELKEYYKKVAVDTLDYTKISSQAMIDILILKQHLVIYEEKEKFDTLFNPSNEDALIDKEQHQLTQSTVKKQKI